MKIRMSLSMRNEILLFFQKILPWEKIAKIGHR